MLTKSRIKHVTETAESTQHQHENKDVLNCDQTEVAGISEECRSFSLSEIKQRFLKTSIDSELTFVVIGATTGAVMLIFFFVCMCVGVGCHRYKMKKRRRVIIMQRPRRSASHEEEDDARDRYDALPAIHARSLSLKQRMRMAIAAARWPIPLRRKTQQEYEDYAETTQQKDSENDDDTFSPEEDNSKNHVQIGTEFEAIEADNQHLCEDEKNNNVCGADQVASCIFDDNKTFIDKMVDGYNPDVWNQ